MMQSISHWGQFEMQAAGTDNFKDWLGVFCIDWEKELKRRFPNGITPTRTPLMDLIGGYDSKYLHG